MPFRFNSKDLAILASNPSLNFQKEGLLWFKEKEGKLFNKSETFSVRLVRLYGNLLFYFKGKDVSSECAGVIVLERYQVVPYSAKEYGFCIEFHVDDEHKYEFIADHKEDYEEWISLINRSSHEKLTKRLQQLRNEIHSFTGKDPMTDHHSNIALDNLVFSSNRMSLFQHQMLGDDLETDCLLMELSIGCTDLATKGGSVPCATIQVFVSQPPFSQWMKHSQTEICEPSCDPQFLRTIVFASSYLPITRIKFVVQDVLNAATNDINMVGEVICTIEQIQNAPYSQLTASIKNSSGSFVGNINILGWQRKPSVHITNPEIEFLKGDSAGEDDVFVYPRNYLTDVKQRFFHIPTKDGGNLKCQEILAATLLCFKIPKQLLSLYISEEKNGVVELHNVGDLHPEWNKQKEIIQNEHIDFIQQYSTILADLTQFEAAHFKKSVDKRKKELSFVPTNLHLQRLSVISSNEVEYFYDVVTVGAPAAHSLKFKHGGLKRLFSSCDEHAKKTLQSDGEEDMRKAIYIKALHIKDSLRCYSHEISHLMVVVKNELKDASNLTDNATHISVKIGELLTMLSTTFIKDCEGELLKARTNGPELRVKSHIISSAIDNDSYRDLVWEWSGVEFKAVSASSQVDTDCNVRETLGRFMGAVNTSFNTKKVGKKDDLLTMLTKLEKAVTSLICRMNVLMRFILMQNQDNSPMNDLRIRKDIVFSQTLTPVVAGFALMLSRKINDEGFLQQIADIGLLVHFESLLTTSGDEMGMLEDMYSGHSFLKNVTFEIVSETSNSYPSLSGTRDNVIVQFPVHPEVFKTLPKKLRDHGAIHLHPVLFSIGINEQATVAERFGDTSLQENLNIESFKYLQIYADALYDLDSMSNNSKRSQKATIKSLMSQLLTTINTKRSKNYDVLLLSEEICMLMNGVRLTSCKSAKDRTSMAVTLEMVKILEREHGMKRDVFQKVLDSFRSQGTRLINSYKNVGLPKYAFNKVQVIALPPVYRPPEGTIGKVEG